MKLLAKAALHLEAQPSQRTDMGCDGLEVLVIGRALDPAALDKSKELIINAAQLFPVIGIELADSFNLADGTVITVDPTSDDARIASESDAFLNRAVDLANHAHDKTGKIAYLQYQKTFQPFDAQGKSPHVNLDAKLDGSAAYHKRLQARSSVPLAIEQSIPVNPSYGKPVVHVHCPTEIRVEDFTSRGIPMAFDVPHYAQALLAMADAKHVSGDTYSLDVGNGKVYHIQLRPSDAEKGARIRAHSDVKEAITRQIIADLHAAKNAGVLSSVQYSGVTKDYGIADVSKEHPVPELFDLNRVLADGVIAARAPYVIAEGGETDWKNAPNQRALHAAYRALQK